MEIGGGVLRMPLVCPRRSDGHRPSLGDRPVVPLAGDRPVESVPPGLAVSLERSPCGLGECLWCGAGVPRCQP
jgi:hypothetical protein